MRKMNALPLALSALLLTACTTTTASVSTVSSAGSASAAGAVSRTAASAPAASEEEPDFLEAVPMGDFSEGLAFARVTLPGGKQENAYITADGEIACTLPEGYDYGFPFHEGYAVVRTVERDVGEEDFFSVTNRDEGIPGLSFDGVKHGASDEEVTYNLINTEGELQFTGGPYRYLSRMGSGKVLAWVEEKTYNGTFQSLYWLDAEENATLISQEEGYSPAALPYLDHMHYSEGVAPLYKTSSGLTYFDVYDGDGDLLFTMDSGGAESIAVNDPKFDTYLIRYMDHRFAESEEEDGIAIAAVYHRPTNTITPLDPYEYTGFGYSLADDPDRVVIAYCGDRFVDGRNLVNANEQHLGMEGFYLVDSNWHTLKEDGELGITNIDFAFTGYDSHWIVALQNDYYGLISTEGELAFEPVQTALSHLGEGLFATGSGDVIDESGETVFTLPDGYSAVRNSLVDSDSEPLTGLFCEGFAVIQPQNRGQRMWIGRDGRELHTSEDFAAYAAWQEANPAAAPTPSPTAEPEPAALPQVQAADGLILRSGPGDEYESLGAVPAGEILTVLEEVDDAGGADWSHVLTSGQLEGYASDDCIYPLD